MQGADGDPVLAARAAEPEPVALHRFDVLRPLVEERHVAPRPGEEPPDDAADRARADDPDAHPVTPPAAEHITPGAGPMARAGFALALGPGPRLRPDHRAPRHREQQVAEG